MALSKKALQRKREKKKKKRQEKVSNPFSSTIIAYHNWSIYECWLPLEIWDKGIGQVIIARENNQGDIAIGVYLIDTFCLGIKNCFVRLTDEYEYQNMLDHIRSLCGEMNPVEPSYAHTLIIRAAEYADQLGFKPHNDFSKAKNLLRGIPIDENQQFTFGRDGKPCYMQGPNESPSDVKRILKILESNQGNENYHFLVETPPSGLLIENEI